MPYKATRDNLILHMPKRWKQKKKKWKVSPYRLNIIAQCKRVATCLGYPHAYEDPGFGLNMRGKEKYQEYLASPWWKWRREKQKEWTGYQCNRCGSKDDLQVHHVEGAYGYLWREQIFHLEVLCGECHHKHHFPDEA